MYRFKRAVHEEINGLCFYGKGGYTWSEVYYMMPSAYRKNYLKIVSDIYKKENEEYEKSMGKSGKKIK